MLVEQKSLNDIGLKSDALRKLEQDYNITSIADLYASGRRLPDMLDRTSERASWGLTRELAYNGPNPHRLSPSDPSQAVLQAAYTLLPKATEVKRDDGRITHVRACDDKSLDGGAHVLLSRDECNDDWGSMESISRSFIARESRPPHFLFLTGEKPLTEYTPDSEAVGYHDKMFTQTVAAILGASRVHMVSESGTELLLSEDGALRISPAGLNVSGFVAPIKPDSEDSSVFSCWDVNYTRIF